MRRFTTSFLSEYFKDHAEFPGVVKRNGRLRIRILVWALVYGFVAGESRTLARFNRSFKSTTDETISLCGFYYWLMQTLAESLHALVEPSLHEVAFSDALDTDIDRFRGVMIADGTVLRLHEFLANEF